MNPLELVKAICQKTRINTDDIPVTACIILNKWLGFEAKNLPIIRRLMDYIWYIEPQHYYYLLYFSIPKSYYVPRFIKKEEKQSVEDKLMERVKYVLGWSQRDVDLNKTIVEHIILKNKSYWKKELGVGR